MLTEDQQGYPSLGDVPSGEPQSTIIIKGPDGTDHVLMAPQGLEGQNISVPELQRELAGANRTTMEEDELSQPTHSINVSIMVPRLTLWWL